MSTEITVAPICADESKSAWRQKAHELKKCLVECALVIVSLVCFTAVLTTLAKWHQQWLDAWPIKSHQGQFVLLPIEAQINGDLQLLPRDMEEQQEDISYTHGRKIIQERQKRKIHWQDSGGIAKWSLNVKQAGDYQIGIRYLASSEVDWHLTIDNQRHAGTLQSVNKTKRQKLSTLKLAAGTHELAFRIVDAIGMPIIERLELKLITVEEAN